MFDLFTEEIEVLIKKGVSNLYWYLGDLEKAWLRAGVDERLTVRLFEERDDEGRKLTKRLLMDALYRNMRRGDFNRRLEVSRNFVRYLVEHKNFVPANDRHRIDVAENCALKLREIIARQQKQTEDRSFRPKVSEPFDYYGELDLLNKEFVELLKLSGQARGYALEKLIPKLMKLSKIEVKEAFRIVGEQIDGAVKYGGHFYLLEIKWQKKKADHADVASLYIKAEGKLEARGIFIAMNGFSDQIIQSLPKGKSLKMLFLDGVHIANVLSGTYKFPDLLDRALEFASLKGEIYCPHSLTD